MRRDPTISNGRSVTVLPGAVHLRRVVGPTAWVVLETLLHDAEPTGSDEYVARRSIRDLAAEIGLAKDTVARAIRALREVGLIKHAQCRTGAGTFDPGRYAISLPNDRHHHVRRHHAAVAHRVSFDAACNYRGTLARVRGLRDLLMNDATQTMKAKDRQVPARWSVS